MTQNSFDEIVINSLNYELLRIPALTSAKLVRQGTNRYQIIVEDNIQKEALERQKNHLIFQIKKWAVPTESFFLDIFHESELTSSNDSVVLRHWHSFDPHLRQQALRWGWINSPVARSGTPLILMILIILLYFLLR